MVQLLCFHPYTFCIDGVTQCTCNADSIFTQQPQRPIRATRVYADENVVPSLGPQKTLHQRNKSSPALSSMLHAGGLKAAAKRTAFGDVSNTSNLLRPSKDDAAIGARRDCHPPEKYLPLQDEKKATALLRPAQRPLSVSGLKGLLSDVVTSTHQLLPKQPEVQKPLQPAPSIRKIVAKRNNTVFKDRSQLQPGQTILKPHTPPPPIAPVAPVRRDLAPRKQSQTKNHSEEPQLITRGPTSSHTTDSKTREDAAATSSIPGPTEDTSAIRSDGVYINEDGEIRLYQYCDDNDEMQESAYQEEIVPSADVKREADHYAATNLLLEAESEGLELEPAYKDRLTSVSEPEEYWDEEEEEEENYDEDGYVTARSYKSRGENTTNGATTVLFPKVNQRVKRELAAAKELIESRSREDSDDEAWDTTMVAEYGDDIFQYMKDLEVSTAIMTLRRG